MELMDPKITISDRLCFSCILFTYQSVTLQTFTFQPQFTNMEGALPPKYYYSAASIQSDPYDVVSWAIQSNNLDEVAVKL